MFATSCAAVSVVALMLAAPQPTPGQPTRPTEWSFTFPAKVEGPIDETLPKFGRIGYTRVCAGDQGRVGVAWVRTIDYRRLRWDEDERLWRVEGSLETLKAGAPTKASAILKEPPYPRERDVYKKGELVGASILGPSGAEGTVFIEGIGPDSGSTARLVGHLGFFADKWHIPLALWPKSASVIDPATHGIAVATLASGGATKPAMVVGGQPADCAWLFGNDSGMDLFWLKTWHAASDPPDWLGGGFARQRLEHTRIGRGASAPIEVVYDRPNHPRGMMDTWHQVLPLGVGRYDLIVERHTHAPGTVEQRKDIVHVPDLLGNTSREGAEVGSCRLNSSVVAVSLGRGQLEVIWLEEVDVDEERRKPPIFRLVEAHLDGESWSRPRVLFEHGAWDYRSLAATSFRVGDQEYVLALWRGEDGFLTYTVGSESGEWSEPVTTKLAIGAENWVVSHGTDFTLVSKMSGNLYRCHFRPLEEPPRHRPGQ